MFDPRTQTNSELQRSLERLEVILSVAQGNTRELEAGIGQIKAEIARRKWVRETIPPPRSVRPGVV